MNPSILLKLSAAPRAAVQPRDDDVSLALRDAQMLAWLALEGPTARVRLAALLWPDSDAEAARNSLRQRLFQLRKQLGLDVIVGSSTLALASGVEHDLADSDAVLGDTAADNTEFGHWLAQQRARRRERMRQSLVELTEMAEDAKDLADALTHASELLALEPLSEDAHRRVIRLHYLGGDRAAALLAFDRCERMLKDEVGARPSAETLELLRTIEDAQRPVTALSMAHRVPVALARPPRLVGRDPELAISLAALDSQRRLVVIGEAGMGKSRLFAEIARHQTGRGRPVLAVQARPGDAAVPYATLARCFRAMLHEVPGVLENAPRDELARLLPEMAAPASRSQDVQRVLLLDAVRAVLERAADHFGCLMLDDLHFIDDASAQMLGAALGSTDASAGLPIALATRPVSHVGADALVAALETDAQTPRVLLAPLGEAALVELVESLALPELDARALAPQLLKHTGGNPLFVLETLKLALAGSSDGRVSQLAFPAGVGLLIDRRLALLSPDAIALARLTAMAGIDFSIELAEQLLQTPALRLADAWNQLESAQVLRGSQFAHDLVFDAVLRSVPEPIARHSHAALARWLEQRAGEPLRIARHWREGGDLARTIAPLIEAARRSTERAFVADARAQLEEAAATARTLGLRVQEFEALVPLHENYALDDPGPVHDALVARLHELAEGEHEQLRARAIGANMLRKRMASSDVATLESDMARALMLSDEKLAVEFGSILVSEHIYAGRLDVALALLERHRGMFECDPTVLRCHEGNLSVVLANLDRYAEADRLSQRAIESHRTIGDDAELMVLLANRSRILRMQGRLVSALELLESMDRWHAEIAPNLRTWAQSRAGASEILRGSGLYAQALHALTQERDKMPALVGPLYPAWAVADAVLWLQLGQHARAEQAIGAVDTVGFDAAPAWLQARVCLTRAQVSVRVRGQGDGEIPGSTEWALLNQAAALAPRDGRRSAWFEVVLQRALWVEPDGGAALAEGLAANAEALGMIGYACSAWWVACARNLDSGQEATAQRCALRAESLALHVFEIGHAPEAVTAVGLPVVWPEWMAIRLDQTFDRPDLAARSARAYAALHTAAREHVPAAFRDSFLHRNPVNRELLALAARFS